MNITCPLCKKNSNRILFDDMLNNGQGISIVKCKSCGHNYTYYEVEIDFDKLYSEGSYELQDTRKSIFYFIQKYEYTKVLASLKKMEVKSILDFGSGKGIFLNFSKEAFFDVAGVETSKDRADYSKKFFDLNINTNFYNGGNIFNNFFDCITLFHVLEHISMPKQLIENLAKDNLSEKGVLLIEVPNFYSWQAKLAGKNWLHNDVPRHVNHFSYKSLESFLNSLGFFVIKTENFSFHLGIIGMVQSLLGLFGYKGSIIEDIKTRKKKIITFTLLLVPIAFVLELIASLFRKGGVIRLYSIRKNG